MYLKTEHHTLFLPGKNTFRLSKDRGGGWGQQVGRNKSTTALNKGTGSLSCWHVGSGGCRAPQTQTFPSLPWNKNKDALRMISQPFWEGFVTSPLKKGSMQCASVVLKSYLPWPRRSKATILHWILLMIADCKKGQRQDHLQSHTPHLEKD